MNLVPIMEIKKGPVELVDRVRSQKKARTSVILLTLIGCTALTSSIFNAASPSVSSLAGRPVSQGSTDYGAYLATSFRVASRIPSWRTRVDGSRAQREETRLGQTVKPAVSRRYGPEEKRRTARPCFGVVRPFPSSGPHHQDSGEAKIRESTAGVSRKPSSDCKACGCSSKHLCGLTAWNT